MTKLIVVADAGGTVNLRQSPSKTASIITRITIKSEVELIEKTSTDWYKVKYGKYEGYMMAKYLKNTEQKSISQDDLRAVYDSLKSTLILIEKILK